MSVVLVEFVHCLETEPPAGPARHVPELALPRAAAGRRSVSARPVPLEVWHPVRVQDRYAGDLGDFLKFGLLRRLATSEGAGRPLRLGVVWYRTADESHNADGKHVQYLAPSHRLAQHMRSLDPDLYDRLAGVIESGDRSIGALDEGGRAGQRYCLLLWTPGPSRAADRRSGGATGGANRVGRGGRGTNGWL